MNITRLSAISLAGLALSAGAASALTIEVNESDQVDLLGPNSLDAPPSEKAELNFGGAGQFFELGAGEHLRVNGTVGTSDAGEDLWDLFKFTSFEKFTVSLIDFEFAGDNVNTGFRMYDDFGELVEGFNLADPPASPNGTLFEDEFQPGTYILGAFETTPGIRQPFHLGVTTHGTPTPPEVPLPAAAWFLVGGMAALGAAKAGRRRRG